MRKIDASGYKIEFMGGYGSRPNNYSLHPSGRALDIDQVSRNRLTRGKHFPSAVNEWARQCGLMHGDRHNWPRYPDYGHFQIDGQSWAGDKSEPKHADVPLPPERPKHMVCTASPKLASLNFDAAELGFKFDQIAEVEPHEEELKKATDYLIRTSRPLVADEPRNTMRRQGVDVAIHRLNPNFRIRLAAAIKEARSIGMSEVGCQSAYRPPVFGIGGFRNKFLSLHSYGLACDVGGLDGPGGKDSRRFYGIAIKHGLYNPYGPRNRAEFNHYQAVPANGRVYSASLMPTITAKGPKSLDRMWSAGNRFVKGAIKYASLGKEAIQHGASVVAREFKLTKDKAYTLIKEEAEKHRLDPKSVIAFVYMENGGTFTGKETERTTSAHGIFGLTAKERARMGQRDNSIEEQVRAGVKHIVSDREDLRKYLKREPTEKELYISHFMGAEAAASIIKSPSKLSLRAAIDRGAPGLGSRAIRANPGLRKLPTVGDFQRSITTRFAEALGKV